MQILTSKISLADLKQMAGKIFGNMVKAVVDIERGIMAVDAELHADEESLLLENGSKQADLWGINIYPDLEPAQRIEFDSMVNLRPALGNRTRKVENIDIQNKIIKIVDGLIQS